MAKTKEIDNIPDLRIPNCVGSVRRNGSFWTRDQLISLTGLIDVDAITRSGSWLVGNTQLDIQVAGIAVAVTTP